MTDNQTSSAEDRAVEALTKILESAISPDMLELQRIVLRRLALAGDVFPSRVPAPANISQVGGYLNLLCDQPEIRARVLASALGVAGPGDQPGTLPVLYFATRENDRPAGAARPSIPVEFTVRSDFAPALDDQLQVLHDMGCTLPILSPTRALPPLNAPPVTTNGVLELLGRTLDLVPRAALVDPADDPLAVGVPTGVTGPAVVLSRQIDATALNAGNISPAQWDVWTCTTTACAQATVTLPYLPADDPMNAAGWFQPPVANPTTILDQGSWSHWTNVTGLVAGTTTCRDELELLYSAGQIVESVARDRLDWVWDGAVFSPP